MILVLPSSNRTDTWRTRLAGGGPTQLSSHARGPRPATSDKTNGSQALARPTASKRASSPPVGTSPPSRTSPTTRIQTASLQAGARAAHGPLARRAARDRATEPLVLELPCAVIARTPESGGGASDARSPGLPGFGTRGGLRRAGAEGAARPG